MTLHGWTTHSPKILSRSCFDLEFVLVLASMTNNILLGCFTEALHLPPLNWFYSPGVLPTCYAERAPQVKPGDAENFLIHEPVKTQSRSPSLLAALPSLSTTNVDLPSEAFYSTPSTKRIDPIRVTSSTAYDNLYSSLSAFEIATWCYWIQQAPEIWNTYHHHHGSYNFSITWWVSESLVDAPKRLLGLCGEFPVAQ